MRNAPTATDWRQTDEPVETFRDDVEPGMDDALELDQEQAQERTEAEGSSDDDLVRMYLRHMGRRRLLTRR
jgi:hypothetical protein